MYNRLETVGGMGKAGIWLGLLCVFMQPLFLNTVPGAFIGFDFCIPCPLSFQTATLQHLRNHDWSKAVSWLPEMPLCGSLSRTWPFCIERDAHCFVKLNPTSTEMRLNEFSFTIFVKSSSLNSHRYLTSSLKVSIHDECQYSGTVFRTIALPKPCAVHVRKAIRPCRS